MIQIEYLLLAIIESMVFLIPLKDTIATKVIKKDGPRQITEVEKVLRWKILGYNGTIPIHVIIDENHQKVTVRKLLYISHKNQFLFGELICVIA